LDHAFVDRVRFEEVVMQSTKIKRCIEGHALIIDEYMDLRLQLTLCNSNELSISLKIFFLSGE